jgi:hypothetical protein
MMRTKFGMNNNLKINTNLEHQYLTENKPNRHQMLSPGPNKSNIKSTLSPPKSNTANYNNFLYPTTEAKKLPEDRYTNQRSNSRCISGSNNRRGDIEVDIRKHNMAISPQSAKMLRNGSKTPSSGKYTPLSTRNTSNESIGNELYDSSNTAGKEIISVMSLLGQNQSPLALNNLNFQVQNYESTKHSVKSMNTIKAYAANTHQGIVR